MWCIVYCILLCSIATARDVTVPTRDINYGAILTEDLCNHVCDDHGNVIISTDDMQYLLNFTYLACKRSMLSILTHLFSGITLNSVWKNHYNVISTLRDPWNPVQYPGIEQHVALQAHALATLMDFYYATGSAYSHAIFSLDRISSYTQFIVDLIRSRSRDIRIIALANTLPTVMYKIDRHCTQLKTTALYNEERLRNFVAQCCTLSDEELSDPRWLIETYVAVDKASWDISANEWELYRDFDNIIQLLWLDLERERLSLYKAYYTTLYMIAADNGLLEECAVTLFDRDGIVDAGEPLPAPGDDEQSFFDAVMLPIKNSTAFECFNEDM